MHWIDIANCPTRRHHGGEGLEEQHLITVPELAAEALGSYLHEHLSRRFASTHAHLTELVPSVARLAIECIGNSDALYHNVEHTMLVTLVGYDIMKGRSLLTPTYPSDYAHLIVACLLHDIGYVRGILKGDGPDGYVIDAKGNKAKLPRGSSDAALLAHHVDRSKLFAMPSVSLTPSNSPAFPRRTLRTRTMKKVSWFAPPISLASSAIRIICASPMRSITSSKRSG